MIYQICRCIHYKKKYDIRVSCLSNIVYWYGYIYIKSKSFFFASVSHSFINKGVSVTWVTFGPFWLWPVRIIPCLGEKRVFYTFVCTHRVSTVSLPIIGVMKFDTHFLLMFFTKKLPLSTYNWHTISFYYQDLRQLEFKLGENTESKVKLDKIQICWLYITFTIIRYTNWCGYMYINRN